VVTWRRAQMVLLSAQGMDIAQIARVTFASPDRVRDLLHNFNLDGFDSRYPRYRGGRPPTFTLAQRRAIKQLALSHPQDHGLPFSTWSLAKLAEFLVAEGVVDDISHEGLRALLREQGVSFQRLKTWKQSRDPDFEATWSGSFSATASVSWRPSWCRVLRAVCARPSPRSSWRRRWRRQAELADGSDPERGRPGRPEAPKAWWLLASGAHCPRQHDEPPSRTWSASLSAIEGSALCGPAFPPGRS
jgi:transposase